MQFKNWMWAVALIIGLSACQQGGTSVEVDVNNEDQKVAYMYGVYTAQQMENQSFSEIDLNAFVQGVRDKLEKGETQISEDSVMSVLQVYYQKKMTEEADKLKAEGIAFLEENKNKEGVQVTESGLQYEVLVEGDGPMPTLQDQVTTHYHGTFIDGKVFDSSVEKGEPITFPVTGVISGWTEALQMMKVGSKWKLYVPSDLAYGERGRQGIPANSALIFEVELLGIGGPEAGN